MWVYVKQHNKCFNTDRINSIFVGGDTLYVTFNGDAPKYEIKRYPNLDYAKSELNKIISAINEDKKVYVIE